MKHALKKPRYYQPVKAKAPTVPTESRLTLDDLKAVSRAFGLILPVEDMFTLAASAEKRLST